MKPIPDNEQLWLADFFSGSNALQWEQIKSGSAPPAWLTPLTPWLEFLSRSPLDRPLLLPVFADDGLRHWYAMAENDQIAAQLLEEVRAFIGPSFSNFSGQWHRLSDSNAPERALRGRFGWRVLRIDLNSETDRVDVERGVARYRKLLSQRPSIPDRTSRPFGAVRTDFDLALLAGNAGRAQILLDELVSSGRIGTDQHRFLQFRFLAGLGRVEEVARDRPRIESIMDLALPPQTIVDVVESLYEVHIEPMERRLDVSALAAMFGQQISRPFGPLFRGRKGIRRPRVLRAFFLFEASQQERNDARCKAIVETYPKDDASFALVQSWFAALVPAKPGDQLERVRQAIADEDYERAMTLSFEGVPQLWAYSSLLRCAIESESEELRGRVSTALQNLEPSVLSGFTERDRARWLRLTTMPVAPSRHPESGWLEWAIDVTERTDEWAPIDVLSRSVLKWDVSSYTVHPESCMQLANLVGNAPERSARIFRDAFPAMVEFFVERSERPQRAFVSIYSMLIKVIAWSGAVSTDELEISTSLARALLSAGPDDALYTECLKDLQEIIGANSAPVHLDWALSLGEMLAFYPGQERELRLRVFYAVFEMCRAAAHRLTAEQRAVLELLAIDYGTPELLSGLPIAAHSTEESRPEFAGVIGIYTLNEPAGQRAREVIERMLPSSKVELSHATAATDRLRLLARNADLFVFAWKTSTHQAFYCVKDARKDRDIIMPSGGGTASLVRSVLEQVRTLQQLRVKP